MDSGAVCTMETTRMRHCGFDVNVRVATPWLDLNILTKLIGDDEYGIQELNQLDIEVKNILDIGGHIGGFGLIAKSFWPEARLIAVEPNPLNAKLYRQNLKDNGLYHNVKVIEAAAGYDKNCNCLVHAPSTTGGGVMRSREKASEYIDGGYRFYNSLDAQDVKIITIEEITKDMERVDLAKWDCEGGEVDCFRNMTDRCAEKFRFMVGEYHIWSRDQLHLKADIVDCIMFWKDVKRKFSHLYFTYKHNSLGLFQAWPKENKNEK
jgi:FkbM family methyltransferase